MSPPDPLHEALGPIASGRIVSLRRTDLRADAVIDASGLDGAARAAIEDGARAALLAVPGIAEARILLTAERTPAMAIPATAAPERRLIAVASGKGGVGKSTVAANLAVALARGGRTVGLVDADIYGPSQPRLLSAAERPAAVDKRLVPVRTRFGVGMLSMGQLVDPGRALAWRGPMASGALGQLVDADWGGTEILILDLPPGTGDVPLTMIRAHRPAGAIVVSTPQDLALIDAARAIDLFAQTGVPVIGLVENMAGYVCPQCGETSHPFGHGGAEAEAAARGIPFLARVPLTIAIRTASDAGAPPAAGDGPEAAPFRQLAEKIAAWLDRSQQEQDRGD